MTNTSIPDIVKNQTVMILTSTLSFLVALSWNNVADSWFDSHFNEESAISAKLKFAGILTLVSILILVIVSVYFSMSK